MDSETIHVIGTPIGLYAHLDADLLSTPMFAGDVQN
jgi:hypothetical protein